MPSSAAKRGRIRAWLVHGYTASGAVLGLAAARAITAHDARLALAAMFLATLVDATDGALARRANIKSVLPDIEGGRIDDLVDYLNFVFLPAFFLLEFGLLPERLGWPIAAAMLLASLYGFVAPDAKTADNFFTGFPSYWNIVALYLFVLHASPAVAAAVLIVLVGLVFVRIGYVYPSRMTVLRTPTVILASVWGALLAAIIWRLPHESLALAILSLLFPVYYIVLSLVLNARRTA
jgi:phosphatidylcholine synthase